MALIGPPTQGRPALKVRGGTSMPGDSDSRAGEQAEARYRLLFEKSPVPMWVFDRDTLAFLEVNDAAVQHYGWSREEFLRMTIRDIRRSDDVAAVVASVGS